MSKGIENVHELTTERIRSRMLKNAARIWGVESEDIESSFDPLVTMMIEACAAELNKINGEILSSQTRILNRLARILSPEALTGPHPCLLYTSDAADERSSVDLGGRRIIKKKNMKHVYESLIINTKTKQTIIKT